MKLKTSQIVVIAIGTLLMFAMFMSMGRSNTAICEKYWDEECSSYKTSQDVCICEGGDYITTREMLQERNAWMTTSKENKQEQKIPNINLGDFIVTED